MVFLLRLYLLIINFIFIKGDDKQCCCNNCCCLKTIKSCQESGKLKSIQFKGQNKILKSTPISTKILTISDIKFKGFQDVTKQHKKGYIPLKEEGIIITTDNYFLITEKDRDFKIFSTRTTNKETGDTIIVASETIIDRQSEYIKSLFTKLANGIYYVVYNIDFEVVNHRVNVKELDKNGNFKVEILPKNPDM